jgi:hypothetical protein
VRNERVGTRGRSKWERINVKMEAQPTVWRRGRQKENVCRCRGRAGSMSIDGVKRNLYSWDFARARGLLNSVFFFNINRV